MFYPLTIRDFLDRAQQVYPNRVAVIDEPDQPAPSLGELTYAQLAKNASAQAARLDELDVPRGGRVAVISHNSTRLLTSFFGVSGWGRVLVPINYRLTADEIEYIVSHSGAEVVYADPDVADVLNTVKAEHKYVLGDDSKLYRNGVDPQPWLDPDESTTATLNYTSGTTAKPKGVQLTHRNLWLNAATFGLHSGISDRDVYLHTLPMFHANGWGMPYAITGVGGQHVVNRAVNGTEILRRIERHDVTMLCAAPTVVNAVLDAAQDWRGPIPGRDRVRIVCAGAPPPSSVIARVIDELGWEFCQLYGLTETTPLVTLNRMRSEWDDLDTKGKARKLMRAGAPALGVRIRVDDEDEILTSSNHNMDGYWQQPHETARVQADDWFHTGDGGYIDDEGYLVIVDRKKDVIISGGENVSSIEVEDVLTSHDAVHEAAVIGIPDQKWGELVTALVVRDGEVSGEDLIKHCRQRIAGFKCPKRIDFVESLPYTATGKLQKFKLREPFWADHER